MERLLVVSSDSHGGPPPADYRPYLDPQHRDALDDHLADVAMLQGVLQLVGYPFSEDVLDVVDDRGAIRGGGADGAFDPARRLREAEAEGVVAEVINPGTQDLGPAPFYEIMCSRYSPELRAAGAMAHNRWLAEFCAYAPDRLLGMALTEPWPDMAAAVAQLHWAREHGLRGVWTDQFAGLEGEAPGLWDRAWDPFWAACADLELPVHIHIGFGIPQGTPQMVMRAAVQMAQDDPKAMDDVAGDLFDSIFQSRKPLWQLMAGGVLDRHPRLRVVLAEQHADWLPATLAYLDRQHAAGEFDVPRPPSEYWRSGSFAVTCTAVRRSDLESRHEVGVERMMFGTDYPHMEGTWPNTRDWLRATFVDVPEAEARAILGENAVDLYGLDRKVLAAVAAEVGPTPAEILDGDHRIDPRLIEQFHRRSGYSKPRLASFDEAELAAGVQEDLEHLVASSGGSAR
jgi:predicted TIM-barrel fold metal-dependent hydrolase